MDDLVGFHVGMWDYITFLALIVIAGGLLASSSFLACVPNLHSHANSPEIVRETRMVAPYREMLVLPSGGMPWKLC
jgi:hypothetical protein